jgi:hypothetical protein
MVLFKKTSSLIATCGICGLLIMACSSTPGSVGGGEGGKQGSAVGGGGGATSGGGGADQSLGGANGVTTFVLPDAAVVFEDALDDSGPATVETNCGSVQSKLEKKPADLLIVLDRSTSMTRAMDSSNDCATNSTTCSQRWATITSSLTKVLSSSTNGLNWGLKFFSTPASGTGGRGGTTTTSCYVSAGVEVAVGPETATTIGNAIRTAGTSTSTPTRAAIEAAVTYLKGVSDSNSKYILLATDGEPNCSAGTTSTSGSDLPATVLAIQEAVKAGYKVFVIGVGPEAANLTSLAQAGGTEKFYSALSPDELSSALSSIVTTVVATCTYELPSVPATPDAVGVFIDKSVIPKDDAEGWGYEAGSNSTITIRGSYCDDLKSGKKTQVEIFLPCKPSDPIPSVIP